ncbi:MAG: AcrR family transcriptional regulator [Planctomycetota bacterium]|jgi:AcrR family transcriptional regulator
MSRSRSLTEARILDAVESLLLEQGYPSVGINAIAREAGCDKVLIYRYFDGFEGLLQRFAESRILWWQVDDILSTPDANSSRPDLPELLLELLKRYLETLNKMPLTLEVMAWEMSGQNPLTRELARQRSERGMLLVKKIRQIYSQPNIDIGGILGVFGAAINYLILRTRKQSQQYKVEEWWRLQQTIRQLLNVDEA